MYSIFSVFYMNKDVCKHIFLLWIGLSEALHSQI